MTSLVDILGGLSLGGGIQPVGKGELPRTTAEFIFTLGKLQVPMCDRKDLKVEDPHISLGACMVVHRGMWDSKAVAVKKLLLNEHSMDGQDEVEEAIKSAKKIDDLKALTAEVRLLTYDTLKRHPNIMRLLGVSWNMTERPGHDNVLEPIVLAELAAGDLEKLINNSRNGQMRLDLTAQAGLICDIAQGIAALHSVGIIHNDLKPSNILFCMEGRPVAKVADFGYSIQTGYGKTETDKGNTPQWRSPEWHRLFVPAEFGDFDSNLDPETTICDEPLLNTSGFTNEECALLEAGDVFSMGLLAMFVLMEDKPWGEKVGSNHYEWVKIKEELQEEVNEWINARDFGEVITDHHTLGSTWLTLGYRTPMVAQPPRHQSWKASDEFRSIP